MNLSNINIITTFHKQNYFFIVAHVIYSTVIIYHIIFNSQSIGYLNSNMCPYKQCYIAVSGKGSTKRLSEPGFSYCDISYSSGGVNCWPTQLNHDGEQITFPRFDLMDHLILLDMSSRSLLSTLMITPDNIRLQINKNRK